MKIIKVLMMLLSIITFSTKVANAATPKKKSSPVPTVVNTPAPLSNTAGAAGVTKTVKEKLDGLNVTKADLEKYVKTKKVPTTINTKLFELEVSRDEYEMYLLEKIKTDLKITCFWCPEKLEKLKKAEGAKKTPTPGPTKSPTPSPTSTPPTVSSTAKVSVFAHSGRYDFLRIGAGLRLLNGYKSEQPIGFSTTNSDTSMDFEQMVELKQWHVGLEYRPGHTVDFEQKFYGSSLGKEKLITSNILVAKLYFVDKSDWSASLGVGMEQVAIEGSYSMGGFHFKNSADAVDYFLQVQGEYHATDWASLRADWEVGGPKLIDYKPGVPDQIMEGTGRVLVMAVLSPGAIVELFGKKKK